MAITNAVYFVYIVQTYGRNKQRNVAFCLGSILAEENVFLLRRILFLMLVLDFAFKCIKCVKSEVWRIWCLLLRDIETLTGFFFGKLRGMLSVFWYYTIIPTLVTLQKLRVWHLRLLLWCTLLSDFLLKFLEMNSAACFKKVTYTERKKS